MQRMVIRYGKSADEQTGSRLSRGSRVRCRARKAGKLRTLLAGLLHGGTRRGKDTGAYPQDGDALRAELQRLTAVVPQITNREAEAAGLAAYGGKLLFYRCDRGTLVELAYLPAEGRYSACAIDAQASRADRSAAAHRRAA